MTFKECRKFAREQLIIEKRSSGFMYQTKDNDWYYSPEFMYSNPPRFAVHKSGKVSKIVNGQPKYLSQFNIYG